MDVHKNAATSPRSRALLVHRIVDEKWTVAAAARAIGISERRAWIWLRRYQQGGSSALADRSSRPKRYRRVTSRSVCRRIVRLRRARLTCRRIAAIVGRSCATVARIVGRAGLSRLRSLDGPPPPVVRYERAHAGELIHLDTKRLARIDGIGHRITGSRHRRARHIGYEFLHVCIDDASRLTYAEILPSEKWTSAVAFISRAVDWFAKQGVMVQRVMTDNGGCYRAHAFRRFCLAAGFKHLFTKPYTPQTNGKAERMIQTLLREWAYRFPFTSSAQRTDLLNPYLHFYNHHRSHRSLSGLPPISRLNLNNVLRPNT